MIPSDAAPPSGPIAVVVVSYFSAAVLERCLASLAGAAPRRGVRPIVVDNASGDDSAAIAARAAGTDAVVRLPGNRGFAAGVNAGLAAAGDAPWVAVLNPDTEVPPGALDALADALEARPRAGLAGPRVVGLDGRAERTVGRFPSLARERAHSLLLDRLPGVEGRSAPAPAATEAVDWVSGCAWLVRGAAARAVGPLDEGYFMYFEDVDYCRRLCDAGWEVLHVPGATVRHGLGLGSGRTGTVPADGGPALIRYFAKFHPEVPPAAVARLLARGWRVRRAWRRLRAALGDASSAAVARRYERALDSLRDATAAGAGRR